MSNTKSLKGSKQNLNSLTPDLSDYNSIYFQNCALFFIVTFLAIDFLPNFGSIEIMGVQYLYLALLNTIIGIWIYYNPAILRQKFFFNYKKRVVFILYFLFLVFSGFSLFFAANISTGIVSFVSLIIVFISIINLIILLQNKLDLIYKISFLIAISVFVKSFIELNNFIQVSKAESLIIALGNLKGNTGNINILSASLSIKIPFLFIGIIYYSNWKKVFLLVSLFLSTVLIFLSGSRAAYLSLFLETILFLIIYIKIETPFKQKKATILFLSLLILFSFLTSNLIFKNSRDTGRYKSIASRVEQTYDLKDSSINMRFGLWKNAVEIIQKNPFTGVGVGNWKLESLPYENKMINDFGASIHAHNDFLEIAAETGILNGIIYFTIFVLLIYLNFKIILKSDTIDSRIVAILCLLTIFSYGIDATFNFPLYRPTMQLGFCLFFVLTFINVTNKEEYENGLSRKTLFVVLIISFLTISFSYKTFKAYQFEHDINVDFASNKFSLSATEMTDKLPFIPNVSIAGEAFSTYLASYYMNEKNYQKAFYYLNKGNRINPYQARMDFNKSIIATSTNKADSALIYARKALNLRPRNKDYYIQAINTAMALKDTSSILQIHKIYTQYNNASYIWANTSSALSQSNFKNDKLIDFLNDGLNKFPGDSLLLERKKLYQNSFFLNKAEIYFNSQNFNKAKELYKKALDMDSSNGILMQNIGLCFYNLKQYEKSIPYLVNSLKCKIPNDGKSEYILGICYYNTKQFDKGCEYMSLAKNKNFSNSVTLSIQICK